MDHESELAKVGGIIRKLLRDEKEGAELADDLRAGLSAMPIWMQDILDSIEEIEAILNAGA